mmetsp:Transcript_35440/g.65113  ORF Transcript_35440/g.65113 Transcript_35440/m.65113 type:complete len:405 (-) Transcript_35440:399-1613(-)|eukprot:CAMPEP_0197439964 /NCGR_PEP_ID=MMETSP1175-20131217/6583_1 /TAXON_ID=1003142 /ORGANISM="Triceratium dubium, Strain CCMP147" /LENGTH=404 /DNA_ID=CAMNT_0042969979 /DNA_START=261 /DNA_END=1475 /DNA_ORIENTATION=+
MGISAPHTSFILVLALVGLDTTLSQPGKPRSGVPSIQTSLHGERKCLDPVTASSLPSDVKSFDLSSFRGGAKEVAVVNENEQESSRLSVQAVSSKVQSVGDSYRHLKRTRFFTLLLLRVAFVLISPLAAVAVILTMAFSLILTALRIIFLNFCFRDTSNLVYAATRAAIAILLACITGIFSPPFAVFGVLAAVSLAGLDMAEPLLRIRYRRQMRKLKHLHKLITDPILMETMGAVLQGAQAIALASARAAESSGRSAARGARTIASASGRSAAGLAVRGKQAVGDASRRGKQAMDDIAAKELVETLLESSGAVRLRETVQSKMPSSVSSWAEDQYQSLLRSGALEAAVSRILEALGNELSGAFEFLPYLEALEEVRKKQGHTILDRKPMLAFVGRKEGGKGKKQ